MLCKTHLQELPAPVRPSDSIHGKIKIFEAQKLDQVVQPLILQRRKLNSALPFSLQIFSTPSAHEAMFLRHNSDHFTLQIKFLYHSTQDEVQVAWHNTWGSWWSRFYLPLSCVSFQSPETHILPSNHIELIIVLEIFFVGAFLPISQSSLYWTYPLHITITIKKKVTMCVH